jgi:hypothetical protein
MSFDLTNKNIKDTFQNLLQRTGSDNRLYDLTGNEIGDLKISGNLIAQQYIVSSSVTNITTQQLSGSTQFGDSLDDIHQFTGSLNVTGSITKGNIPFVLSNQTGSFVTNIDSPSQGNVRKTDAITGVGSNISLGLRTTDNVKFNHITASGNISASGTIIGSNLSGTNTGDQDLSGLALKTEVSGAFTSDSASFSTRISVNEVVTAKTLVSSSAQIASDISGSSTTLSSSLSTRVAANEVITARTLVSSSAQIADDISGSFTSTSSSLSTRLATAESELNNTLISSSLQFDSSDNVTFNNITASGEISASGRVTTLQVGKDSTDQIDFSTDNVLIFRTGNNNRLRLTTGALRPNAAGGIKLGTTSTPFGALHLQGDITASGNISASGDVLNSQVVQMRNSSSVINTFNTGSHQTCKYVLQVTSGSFIQSSEMLVVQSGSNAFNTEYAQIGTAVNLGSFSTSVSGNVVKLSFAGDFISCSVKFNRTLI